MNIVKCPKCGCANDDALKECRSCGYPMEKILNKKTQKKEKRQLGIINHLSRKEKAWVKELSEMVKTISRLVKVKDRSICAYRKPSSKEIMVYFDNQDGPLKFIYKLDGIRRRTRIVNEKTIEVIKVEYMLDACNSSAQGTKPLIEGMYTTDMVDDQVEEEKPVEEPTKH